MSNNTQEDGAGGLIIGYTAEHGTPLRVFYDEGALLLRQARRSRKSVPTAPISELLDRIAKQARKPEDEP